MARLVLCRKLGRELPGFDAPPFAGELGQRIYDEISTQAFGLWQEHAKTLIGSYRLNLADQAGRDFLVQQMDEFLLRPRCQYARLVRAGRAESRWQRRCCPRPGERRRSATPEVTALGTRSICSAGVPVGTSHSAY